MRQTKYKWDIEGLQQQLNALKREKETLEHEKEFLRTLTEEVQQNWQSLAGNSYKGKLEVDMDNYAVILQGLERKIEALNHIVSAVYRECEQNVESKVRMLQGSIPVI